MAGWDRNQIVVMSEKKRESNKLQNIVFSFFRMENNNNCIVAIFYAQPPI